MKKSIYILFALLILAACSKESIEKPNPNPDPNPDPNPPVVKEYKISDKTKVVDELTRSAIETLDLDDFTFTFSENKGVVKELKVDDILVDSVSPKAPNGYLRKVTEIHKEGNKTIVKTKQARLTEAIPEGSIRFKSGKMKERQLVRTRFVEGVTLKKQTPQTRSKFTVFNISFDKEIKSERGNAEGKVRVHGETNIDLEFIFDFDWSFNEAIIPPVEVDLFQAGVGIHQSAALNVDSETKINLEKEFTLGSLYFSPITFMIGPVPVVFCPEVELILSASGQITGVLHFKASESYDNMIGVKYSSDDGWGGLGSQEFDTDFAKPSLDANASVGVSIGPRASLKLYGVAGVYTSLMAKARLNASLKTQPDKWNMSMKLGLCAYAGVEVDILFVEKRWEKEIFCKSIDLFKLENEPIGDGISIIYPNKNGRYPIGKNIKITSLVTGEKPTEVQFFIDGNKVNTDTEAPFEYEWDTKSQTKGAHTIQLKSVVNGETIESKEMPIELFVTYWEKIDIAKYVGTDKFIVNNIFFSSPKNGYAYITGVKNSMGFDLSLHTNDGGDTWHKGYAGYSMAMYHGEVVYLGKGRGLYYAGNGALVLDDDSKPLHAGGGLAQTPTNENIFGTAPRLNGILEARTIVSGSKGTLFTIGGYGMYTLNSDDQTTRLYEIAYREEGTKKLNYIVSDDILVNTSSHNYAGELGLYMNHDLGMVYNLRDGMNGGNSLDNNQTDADYRPEYMLSKDGGATWKRKRLNVIGITKSDKMNDVCFINDQEGWMVGYSGLSAGAFTTTRKPFVLKTTDGGESWQRFDVNNAPDGVHGFYKIWFINSNEGFALAGIPHVGIPHNTSAMYKTVDGGQTWEEMEEFRQEDAEPFNTIFFPNADVGFVGGDNCMYRYVGK